MPEIQVKYDNDTVMYNAPFEKAIEGDAGIDLYNSSGKDIIISPGHSVMVPAGISVKIPKDHCALVYPRSSAFHKKGLFVVPGLIDSGYTGSIFTIVWYPNINGVERPMIISPWERLSQLLILPIPQIDIKIVNELPITTRGSKGFGSTG